MRKSVCGDERSVNGDSAQESSLEMVPTQQQNLDRVPQHYEDLFPIASSLSPIFRPFLPAVPLFTLLGQILPLAPGCLQTLHRNGTKNPALPLAEVAAPCPHSLSPFPVPAPCPLLANTTGESGGPGGGGQQRLPSCHFQICFGFAECTLIK